MPSWPKPCQHSLKMSKNIIALNKSTNVLNIPWHDIKRAKFNLSDVYFDITKNMRL